MYRNLLNRMPRMAVTVLKPKTCKSSYWIFSAFDVEDVDFPHVWECSSRHCRWWIGRPCRHSSDVYGILQLKTPLAVEEVLSHLPDGMDISLASTTLRVQTNYEPPAADYCAFEEKSYGIPRYHIHECKTATHRNEYYKSVAITLGMDPKEATCPARVVAFFQERKACINKDKEKL